MNLGNEIDAHRERRFRCTSRKIDRFLPSVENNQLLLSFCITTLRDWRKKLAPLFSSNQKTTKITRDSLYRFSRTSFQLHVFATSFCWLTGLSVCFVIAGLIYYWFSLRHSIENCSQLKTVLFCSALQSKCFVSLLTGIVIGSRRH